MELPPFGTVFINGLVAAAAVLCVLRILAARLGHACELHDLQQECDRLRNEYAARLAALRKELDGEILEAEVVGQVDVGEAAKLAA